MWQAYFHVHNMSNAVEIIVRRHRTAGHMLTKGSGSRPQRDRDSTPMMKHRRIYVAVVLLAIPVPLVLALKERARPDHRPGARHARFLCHAETRSDSRKMKTLS